MFIYNVEVKFRQFTLFTWIATKKLNKVKSVKLTHLVMFSRNISRYGNNTEIYSHTFSAKISWKKRFGLYRILYCFRNLFRKYEQYLEKLQIGSTCIHRFSTVKVRIFKELIARKFIIFSKLIARKFIFIVNCKGCFLGLQNLATPRRHW